MSVTHRLCGRAWAIVLGSCLIIATEAIAAIRNWTGTTDSEWTKTTNWSNGVPLLGDTAVFSALSPGASTTPTIETGDVVDLSSILFSSGAPAYQLKVEMGLPIIPDSLTLSGEGISNSSGVLQTITFDAGFALLPPDPATAWQGGRLLFTNDATINAGAGVTIVLNSPQVVGFGSKTPASFTLENYASAGNARINVLADHNGAGDGNAFVRFRDLSNAGSAQIDIEGGYNDGGYIVFENASTAANAWISNRAGSPNGGYTLFLHGSRAGSAQISNQGSSSSTIGGGRTLFRDDGKALTANITNYGGNGGNGGITIFDDASSASDATITALGGTSGGAGGITEFKGNSTAANATLIANGSLGVGQGGTIRFLGNANGSKAAVVINAGGFFDISGISTTGAAVDSIAGDGSFILGNKNLTIGSNDANTTVSGVISGVNSTLTKTGNGTLTLSGTNTFSGGFVVRGGGVNVNSSSALGPGVFSILSFPRVGSTNMNAIIPNQISLGAEVRLVPVNNPAAELEFTGPVDLVGSSLLIPTSVGKVRFSNSIAGVNRGLSFKTDLNVSGSFILSGNLSNTYTNSTNVNSGSSIGTVTLVLAKTAGATAIPSDLSIYARGTVRLAQPEQIADGASVNLSSGATLDLDGYSEKVSKLTTENGSTIQLHSASGAGTLTVDSGSVSGAITDGGLGGNLTKLSAGTLSLRGANTYSGTTRVSGGTLSVGNTGASAVIVEPGATLAGDGRIGGTALIRDQAILSPTSAPGGDGILTFDSDLTLSSDSQILMTLRAPGNFTSPNNDRISARGVNATLTLDGTLQFDTTNGFGGAGRYLLFTYSGTLIDNGLNIATPPPGFSLSELSLDFSQPGQIILHVPEPLLPALVFLFAPLLTRRRRRY